MTINVLTGGTRSGTTTVAIQKLSTEKDRVVYELPTHTVKAPRLMIFTRSIPSGANPKELQKIGVKVVFGDRNSDGTLRSGNVIGNFSLTIPQDQPASLAEDLLLHVWGFLSGTSLTTAMIETGVLPDA
jgi:hypothetical protein